jgi:hypothetical protein
VCGSPAGLSRPPRLRLSPHVEQPHWLLGFGASGALKYGERARVRARGVMEMNLTGNTTRSTTDVEMGPVSRL